ncbi:MAG: GHKL domain-containing protein [Oscillibacter sp.]|nr:GHKL domain-containing protein [Oscillibacter sp.]
MTVFVFHAGNFVLDWLQHWYMFVPLLLSAFFLCKISAAFLPVKPQRGWRAALFALMAGVTGMVIWVGDDNILFTMPVFLAAILACSRGDRAGRLAVGIILFCLIMPVSALLDTYLGELMWNHKHDWDAVYEFIARVLRPVIWGSLYLGVRRRLPERTPQLSPRLWKLVLALSVLPFCSMMAVMLLTSQIRYESDVLHGLTLTLGLAVLPFVFLTALALLYAILLLENHERLEEADKLSSLRESYYQALRREDRQVRTLRHDLRNHLTVVQSLLDQGEADRAARYLEEIAASPAMGGRRSLCENETANIVLAAKAEAMEQAGVEADFSVTLPKELAIADLDLCALLGNALDNALEAAVKTPGKWVKVRCRVEKGLFMLRVDNALPAGTLPDLETTKKDKSSHGFGLTGMREIAERYGGSLEVRALMGRFELVACLPLPKGS